MSIATDPFSLLFIVCFLAGLLFLVVTALMGNLTHGHNIGHDLSHHVGGHHVVAHAGHAAHPVSHAGHSTTQGGQGATNNLSWVFGYINPMTLALFLTGFGFLGYVFHNNTALALPFTLILAGVSGFIIASVLLALLNRVFGDSEGETVQDVADRTGLLGKVSLTIQENSLGEILYVSPGGMRKSVPARSIDGRRLERDQEVVVVNYQKGIAEVDTWDHFINQEESEGAIASPRDDLATLRALLEEPARADAEYVIRKDVPKE
ncbi:MAG TPA: hypothetical protein VKR06_27830 [Ktedonosporobacter sp.]|nr:hypothetical protein [Ktedonosporobacter sp.]